MGAYTDLRFWCDEHSDVVISAGEPMEVFHHDASHRSYLIDPSNMYCTGGEGEHKFVAELTTSDGVSIRVPLPKE